MATLTTNQLVVGMFNMASGGYKTIIDDYLAVNPASAAADALLGASGLNPQFMGTNLYDNAAFASALVGRVMGGLSTTVQSSISTIVANFMATNPTMSRGAVVSALIEAVLAIPTTDATLGSAVTAFTDKVALADAYTGTSTDFSVLTQALGVTPTPTAGTTFTLTAGADALVGTSNDEVFNGLATTNAINGNLQDTFQSVDSIQGGEGTDTVNAQLGSSGTATTVGIAVQNVEKFNITAFSGDTFNMAAVVGATEVNSVSSVGALTLTNVGSLINIGLESTKSAMSATFADAVINGTTDSVTVTLKGADGNQNVTLTNANQEIETVNVASSTTANKVTLLGTAIDAAKTLNISGDANLNMTATALAGLTTVDGSTATGKLTLDVSGASATNLSVKSGTADDKVTVDGVTKDDTFDLGEGSDTLVIKTAGALANTATTTFTNVETIVWVLDTDDSGAESSTQTMVGATSLTTAAVGVKATDTDTINMTNLGATATTLVLNAGGNTTAQTFNTAGWGLADDTGTSDALTISVTNKDANGNEITISTKGVQMAGTVTANGIESITIDSVALGANSDNSTAATADGGVALSLNADELKTLTLKGSTLIDIDGVTLDDNLKTITATEATGGVSVDMSAVADTSTTNAGAVGAITATFGSGMDYVKTVKGTVNTTIDLGAGNDMITFAGNMGGGGGAVETITVKGGAGNDSIDISADATASTVALKKITTGDGVDTVKINGAEAQTGITISDFTTGAGGDKIDLLTNAGTATTYLEGVANIAGTVGMYVDTNNTLATADGAGVETLLNGRTVVADDIFYLIASNGTNAYLFFIEEDGSNTAITAAADSITLIATLTGVSDASKLAVDNFSDFLA